LDAGLEVPFQVGGDGPRWILSLRAENLLDEHFEEVVGFPAPGRALYVGARVVLGGG
jgi:outer membrane cobalamin receptor